MTHFFFFSKIILNFNIAFTALAHPWLIIAFNHASKKREANSEYITTATGEVIHVFKDPVTKRVTDACH